MRIIVTGLVGQYAFGGVAWDYLQFVEGFRQLGHDVFYLEDTEMWPYDPIQNTISEDCHYNVSYLRGVMEKLGLADRWMYRSAPDASYHGHTEAEAKEFRDRRSFLERLGLRLVAARSSPSPTRRSSIPIRCSRWRSRPATRTCSNGSARTTVTSHLPRTSGRATPVSPTRFSLDSDAPTGGARLVEGRAGSTTQRLHHGDELGVLQELRIQRRNLGTESVEFLKFLDLPQRTAQKFEIAMGMGPGMKRPTDVLQQKGWRIIEQAGCPIRGAIVSI